MENKINQKNTSFIDWMSPLLEVMQEKGGSATPKEARDGIAEKMNLDDDFLSIRLEKSNHLRFSNQVYWAKQYLSWEKMMESSKHGVWTLTEEGLKTSLSYDDAVGIAKKWQKVHSLRKKQKAKSEDESEIAAETSQGLSLLEILKQTSPTGFEHLCGRLLREYDFEDIKITQKSNDKGIDGTATLKLNPFLHMSVFFQCKRYDSSVPISHVREFVGVLATERSGVDRGILLTTGSFSKEAREIERKSTNLELIDGEKLVEMFEKAEIGVKPRTVYDPDIAFFAEYMEK